MNHIDKVSLWLRDPGVEIGAFKTPIPGIKPVYVDKFAEFAHEKCLADYEGEAIALPFRDDSLNYVASSHVLEHVANPVLALEEWCRVLRPGGIIYFVVPDKRYTWDHARATTPVAHLLEDYERKTTAADATHIDDFVDNVDWTTFSPSTPPDLVPAKKAEAKAGYHNAAQQGIEINIHFHVFEPASVIELISTLHRRFPDRFDWELVDSAERFPADNPIGFLAVIKVHKSWPHAAAAWLNRRRYRRDPRAIISEGAKNFPA
ncbi:MAG TPA: class I SAM-dependent methyltransferase [Opitutaceae bacterium]|nr:class I SAM-dependent methyltransferase [Opitutaceae bacterium]